MAKRSQIVNLDEALKKASRNVDAHFKSANQKTVSERVPDYGSAVSGLVERVFSLDDPDGTMDEIIEAIENNDSLTPGNLRSKLAGSANLLRKAHLLLVNTKEAYQRFEHEYATLEASMREEATRELELEKRTVVKEDAKGKPIFMRTKMVTDPDVMGRVAEMYPDEFREMANRKLRGDKTIDHISHLVKVVERRHAALNTLVGGKEKL